jgi:acyl-CoA reductase-like NAD-dependent aldehyde dehydrogenase
MMIKKRYGHYINGDWVAPASGEYFESVDPSTGKACAEIAQGDAEDIDRAVEAARAALKGWRKVDPGERGSLLQRIAARIREAGDDLARIEAIDCGLPLRDCLDAATNVAARRFEYYAGLADKLGGETIPVPGNNFDYTLREPLGVVGLIIPWNSPLWVGSRSIAPALAAGNTVVLKPAEEAMLTMLHLAEIMAGEGLPAGVFNIVTGDGPGAGAALASHPTIDGLTFTGSVQTGKRVMKMAAENVVPVNLELGGKSANIIFPDADMDSAVMWAMIAIFAGSGQICVAGSRLLLHRRIHDEFLEKLVQRTKQLRVGPPLENPDMGPLISQAQLDRVLNFMEIAKVEGAQLAVGGQRLMDGALGSGYFVAPTIFDSVQSGMIIAQEEIFGPVLSVMTFDDEDQAIHIANETPYGLAAAVWTKNLKIAHHVAKQLEAGSVFINRYFSSGIESPAGGYKRSGFGRADGVEVLRYYTQIKNVIVSLD